MTTSNESQFHLVVYWSADDGWQITEMEPSSDGWIWTASNDSWRDAIEDGDNEQYAILTRKFYAALGTDGDNQ